MAEVPKPGAGASSWSVNDRNAAAIPGVLSFFIFRELLHFLEKRVRRFVKKESAKQNVWQPLRRSFILLDEFWCSLLQISLGYLTSVGRSPILLKTRNCRNYDDPKRLFKNYSHNFTLILPFFEMLF